MLSLHLIGHIPKLCLLLAKCSLTSKGVEHHLMECDTQHISTLLLLYGSTLWESNASVLCGKHSGLLRIRKRHIFQNIKALKGSNGVLENMAFTQKCTRKHKG